MKNEELFSGRAENYVNARPGYPAALLDWLRDTWKTGSGISIADIGSGTGIFTGQLLALGADVYAVEPNDDMRMRAERALGDHPGFHSICGTAGETALADQSMDYVTAAQAFHWFDPEAFARECRRVLKPDGRILLVWNLRVESAPVTQACSEIFRAYCPRFRGYNTGMKAGDERILRFFGGRCREMAFDHALVYDREHFLQRYLSSSYSLRKDEPGYEACLDEVGRVFDRFSRDGSVTVPNRTYAYEGTVGS